MGGRARSQLTDSARKGISMGLKVIPAKWVEMGTWLAALVAYVLTRDMPGDDARFNVNISAGSSLAFSLRIWAMVIV